MFSRSQHRSVEKATAMWKRIQGRKKEEELAVAKPRSVFLISTRASFQYPGDLQLDSGSVEGARRNCRRDIVQNRYQKPETCSQVLKGDNPSQRSCGKLQRSNAQGAMPDSSEGAAGNCWQDYVQGNMPKSSRGGS